VSDDAERVHCPDDRPRPGRNARATVRRPVPELQGQRGLAALCILVFQVYQYDRSGPDAPTGMAAAVVAVVVPRTLGRPTTWALRTAGVGGSLVTATVLVECGSGSRDRVFHLLCGLAFAAVLLAGALGPSAGPWHRVTACGALPRLGVFSYSIYPWHEPLLLQLSGHGLLPAPAPDAFLPTVGIVVPLAVLAAWASYWLVEYLTSHLRVLLTGAPSRELVLERRRAL
jgi:peptidoglycan/LPS O-acetylase OafA/YrhL